MKCVACLLLWGLLARGQTQPVQVTFDDAVQALSAGDYRAAEQGFQAVLKRQPNNVGAIGNLGILYARTNRMDRAISQYQRALQLSPNDEPILPNLETSRRNGDERVSERRLHWAGAWAGYQCGE